MKQFSHLNNVLAVQVLEATDEGVFLNQEQLQSVEDRLELNQQLSVERDQALQLSADAIATDETSRALLASAYEPFNAIDQRFWRQQLPKPRLKRFGFFWLQGLLLQQFRIWLPMMKLRQKKLIGIRSTICLITNKLILTLKSF